MYKLISASFPRKRIKVLALPKIPEWTRFLKFLMELLV